VRMDGKQLSSHPITSGLAGSVMHWASPVKADAKVGDDEHRVSVLLESSDASWKSTSTDVAPDPTLHFAAAKDVPADKKGSQVLAVAIVGGFTSEVAKPRDKSEKPKDKPADPAAKEAARLVEHSPPDTRMVVFGSSAFVSDDILALSQQLRSDFAKSNLELVHNAVDWALADTDLLEIRSHNEASRALTVSTDSRGAWLNANIAIAVLGLVLVVGFAWLRRRAVQPIIAKEG
jgi:ABC-2 type transport system permease protein